MCPYKILEDTVLLPPLPLAREHPLKYSKSLKKSKTLMIHKQLGNIIVTNNTISEDITPPLVRARRG